MGLFDDLTDLLTRFGEHSHDPQYQADVLNKIKAILNDHETRIAALEAA